MIQKWIHENAVNICCLIFMCSRHCSVTDFECRLKTLEPNFDSWRSCQFFALRRNILIVTSLLFLLSIHVAC
jgi:hypothetical protein